MRKFLVAIILCVLPVVSFGWSSKNFYIGKWQECFIDRNGNDAYYFCSYPEGGSCNDIKKGRNDKIRNVPSGTVLSETLLKDGNKNAKPEDVQWLGWVCCRVSGDGEHGHWKAPSKTQRNKEVRGGTCKQTIDQCGTVVEDCDSPTDCPEGTTERTILGAKYCSPICPAGQGYVNENSTSCVSCETSLTQGVDGKGVCRKCDASTQFFRAPTANNDGGCKSLEDASNKYSNAQMQICWKCANDNTMAETCFGKAQSGIKDALDYAKDTCLFSSKEGTSGSGQ